MLAIHGDKQQNERDWVLNEFKTGKSPIMVATDVASRGIGMIEIPLPQTATPSSLPSAILSTLKLFLDCVIMPGFPRVFWFSNKRFLGSAVQHPLLHWHGHFPTRSTFPGTRCGIGIS